jgi:hypothetical protein
MIFKTPFFGIFPITLLAPIRLDCQNNIRSSDKFSELYGGFQHFSAEN